MSRALEAAEKLIQVANFTCLVSGHDFSRAGKANKINVGLQPLQNLLSAIRSSKPFFRNPFSHCGLLSSVSAHIPRFSAT
jgi:hypothetical protein